MGKLCLELAILNAYPSERGPQNRNIRHAVARNTFDGCIYAIGLDHAATKCIPVNHIAAVKQRAVDIENVSVCARKQPRSGFCAGRSDRRGVKFAEARIHDSIRESGVVFNDSPTGKSPVSFVQLTMTL